MRIAEAASLIAIIALQGCSATLETRLSKNSPNAPINEINGGVVSYLNQGYNFAIQKRREDAYEKMADYCAGPYKIIQEGEHLEEGMAAPVGDVMIYGNERRWNIRFECVEKS